MVKPTIHTIELMNIGKIELMRISNLYVWVVVAVVSAVCLYPLQKLILKNHKAKKLALREEVLEARASYLINLPDETYELDNRLSEISGLSQTTDESILIGVQDEEGILFYLDKLSGDLIRQIKFGGDEDYEGVVVVGDQTFVVSSKGDITIISGDQDVEITEVKKIKTFLKRSDDVEGLTYLKQKNALLVACKSNQDGNRKTRNIYLFNLESMELQEEPFLKLDPEEIAQLLGRDDKTPYFSPSAIAVHPLTNELFVVSSPAHAIIVFDENGNLKSGANLDRVIHAQPEGMIIDEMGNLFIASEARGTVAKLQIFNPNTQ